MTATDVVRSTVAMKELQSKRQWVCWCLEDNDDRSKKTKVPYQARNGYKASTIDPDDWATYEECIYALEHRTNSDGVPYSGVGFVFNNDDTGMDLDHCVAPDGSIDEWAQEYIDLIGSYAEFSPSDTGIHVIMRAKLPEVFNKNKQRLERPGKKVKLKGKRDANAAIEMYCQSRFFTVTGNHVPSTPTTIEEKQAEVLAIFDEISTLNEPSTRDRKSTGNSQLPATPVDLDDAALIEKAMSASNGTTFRALWNGNTSGYYNSDGEDNDHSSADLALCNLLAFWTGRDTARMDKLFRQSGLMRDKWDRNARSGETYGQGTIDRAIASCNEVYTGSAPLKPNHREAGSNGHSNNGPAPDTNTSKSSADNPQTEQSIELTMSGVHKAIKEKNAKVLIEHSPVLAQLSRQEYTLLKLELKETFKKDINFNDLDACVNAAKKDGQAAAKILGHRVDLDYVARLFEERYGDTWAYDANCQLWREWTGTHWAECFTPESEKLSLDNLFTDLLHGLNIDVNGNNTLDCIHRRSRGICKRDFISDNKHVLVNFRNGTLEINANKYMVIRLRTHNREDNLTYCLDYDYEAGSFHKIQTFMDESLPDLHSQQAYMATLGLALMGDVTMQYYLFLYGKPNSGKSTYLRLGNAVCGHTISNYSSFTGDMLFSDELEGERERYLHYQRRIVSADELKPETFREHENTIKTMTAHMGVPIRGIMKNGQKDNQWKPKIMMTANELPHYKDTAGGLKRRTLYLYFPTTKDEQEQDPTLFNQLLEELGPFAYACIQLGLAVLKRRYYPKSKLMKKTSHDASIHGNTLKTFVEDHCILFRDHPNDKEEDYRIFSGDLHEKYKEYCLENDNKPGSTATMTTALKEMSIGVTSSDKIQRLPGSLKPGRVLYGIRLRFDSDPLNEDLAHKSISFDDILLAPDNEFVTMPSSGRYNSQNGSTSHVNDNIENGLVTLYGQGRYNSQNGSTSQSNGNKNEICNDVTMFSGKDVPTRPYLDDTRGKVFSIEAIPPDFVVTSLQNCSDDTLNQPVEPIKICNDACHESLQVVTPSLQNDASACWDHLKTLHPGLLVYTPEGSGTINRVDSMGVDIDFMGRIVHYTGARMLSIQAD